MIALLLLVAIPALILTIFAIPYIVKKTEEMSLFDTPSLRKIHTTPVSRMGGLCFMPIMLISMVIVLTFDNALGFQLDGGLYGITNTWRMIVLILSTSVLYITGIFDDLYGLGYKVKFCAQILSAVLVAFGLCAPVFGITYQIFVIIFFIVFVLNAVNLIDGIDGLASGIAIITLIVLLICHSMLGNWFGALLSGAMLSILAVYFYYNVYSWEYKIFMGDTGSLTIGLVIAYLIVSAHVMVQKGEGGIPYYLPICIAPLTIPMADLVRVFFYRLFNHKNPFLPDKKHIHHLLMAKGLTQSQVLQYLLFDTCLIAIGAWVLVMFVIHK